MLVGGGASLLMMIAAGFMLQHVSQQRRITQRIESVRAGRVRTRKQGSGLRLSFAEILGVRNLRKGQSAQFINRIPDNVAKPLVHFQKLTVQVGDNDADSRLIEGRLGPDWHPFVRVQSKGSNGETTLIYANPSGHKMRMMVVLPAPLLPSRPTISFLST